MPAKSDPERAKSPPFETAIARLEEIVEQMESDQLSLDHLLARYEEGMKLVKLCSAQLQAAEKRIEIIARTAAGEPVVEPFPEAAPPPVAAREQEGEPRLF